MEKFYIVTEESYIHREYFQWRQNAKDVNVIVKEIMEQNGMETHKYCIGTNEDYFMIFPTENDLEKFKKQMKKDSGVNVASSFKKTSSVFKEVFKRLAEINLKVLHEPMVQWEFPCCGKSRSRLFDIDGVLYASYEHIGEFSNPKGFKEISGSEFYKILESEK